MIWLDSWLSEFWVISGQVAPRIQIRVGLRTVPGNQGFIILATFSSNKKHNREKILYHPLMSIYTLRHHTTGQLPRVQPHDIVIFAVVPFFGLGAGHRLLPSVFEGWHWGGRGVLDSCRPRTGSSGVISYIGTMCSL